MIIASKWTKIAKINIIIVGDYMEYFHENRVYSEDLPLSIQSHREFNFYAHWHTDIEVVLVRDGSITMGVNDEKRQLIKGDMAICSSGDIHYFDSRGKYSDILILIFKSELIGSPVKWPVDFRFLSPFISSVQLDSSIWSQISGVLDFIRHEINQKNTAYEMLIKAKLYELCAMLVRYTTSIGIADTKKYKTHKRLEKMQRILSYLQDNYINDLTVIETSKQFKMSQFHFCRLFKSMTGVNFKTYLNTIRVTRAEELIVNTGKPITEIAFECGFNSIRTFNRVYKKIKGCTPSKLR